MNKLISLSFFFFFFSIFIGFSGCVSENGKSSTSATDIKSDNKLNSASDNISLHYWDDFDFEDTSAVKNPDVGEQTLVDFIATFSKISDTIRSQAINNMLSKAKPYPTSFKFFTQQYERYLYDPNSPMRNDLYYEPVLEFLVDSCLLNDADEYRYNMLLELIRKNKVGMKAMDFEFMLPEGDKSNLYEINSPFTVLLFYEPGCSHCEEAIDQFQNEAYFQQQVDKGMLSVLAVYAFGDANTWEAYQSHIPAGWVNGFEWKNKILSEKLYDLKASPTIYLLDKDKKVLLKDTELSQLALFLTSLSN